MLAPGEISLREYDYLLTMPVLSLTEEKVDELQRLLKEKKTEYDKLFKLHIYEMWERDLDSFVEALHKQNEIEERDRLAFGATNGGADGRKRGGGKKGNTAGGDKGGKENAKTARGQGNAAAGRKPAGNDTR